MIKLSRKAMMTSLVLSIVIMILITVFLPHKVVIHYSGAMAVESNQILKSFDNIMLEGTAVRQIDLLNFKLDSIFNGKLIIDGKAFDIIQCGIADKDRKSRYFGFIEERQKTPLNSNVLVMSKDFKYICIYDRTNKTYTIAPAKTIEDYYKVDKLIN